MGCCSSKKEDNDPPGRSSVQQVSTVPASSNHRGGLQPEPQASPVIPSLPPAAKGDSFSPKPFAGPGKRGRFESSPGPIPKNPTQIPPGKRERVLSAPGDVPSYRKKTAVNICLEALNILNSTLSTVPIPALSAAPMMLTAAIQRIQAMSSAEEGWNELTKRLQHLTYLTQRLGEAPGAELDEIVSSCLKPVAGQLKQLAIEIDKNGKDRKALQRFLTSKAENDSITSHHKVLDRLISELTSKLCMNTALSVVEVRNELKHISESLELGKGQGGLPVPGVEMKNNRIMNVGGSAFSNLRFLDGMSTSMVGNIGANIGGDAFSNISFQSYFISVPEDCSIDFSCLLTFLQERRILSVLLRIGPRLMIVAFGCPKQITNGAIDDLDPGRSQLIKPTSFNPIDVMSTETQITRAVDGNETSQPICEVVG